MDTSSITEGLTEQVRAAMKQKGVSQRELSKQTGIPLQTLNARLLVGTTRPFHLGELAQVLNALDLSLVEMSVRAERAAVSA